MVGSQKICSPDSSYLLANLTLKWPFLCSKLLLKSEVSFSEFSLLQIEVSRAPNVTFWNLGNGGSDNNTFLNTETTIGKPENFGTSYSRFSKSHQNLLILEAPKRFGSWFLFISPCRPVASFVFWCSVTARSPWLSNTWKARKKTKKMCFQILSSTKIKCCFDHLSSLSYWWKKSGYNQLIYIEIFYNLQGIHMSHLVQDAFHINSTHQIDPTFHRGNLPPVVFPLQWCQALSVTSHCWPWRYSQWLFLVRIGGI